MPHSRDANGHGWLRRGTGHYPHRSTVVIDCRSAMVNRFFIYYLLTTLAEHICSIYFEVYYLFSYYDIIYYGMMVLFCPPTVVVCFIDRNLLSWPDDDWLLPICLCLSPSSRNAIMTAQWYVLCGMWYT